MKKGSSKYIFIDTNLFRDLFVSDNLQDRLVPALQKLTQNDYILLLPQQVIDEINRNRYTEWANDRNGNKIASLTKLKEGLTSFPELKSTSLIRRIDARIVRFTQQHEKNKKHMTSGKAERLLKTMQSLATVLPDSSELAQAVQLRVLKGNPPLDRGQVGKNCDKYIWECLLKYFRDSGVKNPSLLFFTANHNDWCLKQTAGNYIFHPFLQYEFKSLTKGKIEWKAELSDLPEISTAEKDKIQKEEKKLTEERKAEKVKLLIADKFKFSNSWSNTESLIRAVLPYVDWFDEDTISGVLNAAIENNQYSHGPYNQVLGVGTPIHNFLIELFERSLDIGYPLELWKRFYLRLDQSEQEQFYWIREKLQSCGIKFDLKEIQYIHSDDIPF